MPRPLEREKPLQRVNIMLDCEALENAQRAAALVGVDPSIVGSNSAFIRWLIDRYNEQASEENLSQQLSKISEIKEFVLSGGQKQLRMQKLKAQAELFEATYGKKRAKKLIDKMKNHNRFFEGLSDIPKASHKGERDDAIQAARVGMKMADEILNKEPLDGKTAKKAKNVTTKK